MATASGACTLTIVEMMRVFMASRERRLVSVDHLLAASVELAALGQSIADLTAADGSSALTFRVAAASDALGVVKTRAQLIDDTVRLIQRIAAQTNMLALNATIEAARAGQHGRAFSVVANEVKELSVSTRDALDQINKLVDALKGSVEDAGRAVGGVHGVVVQLADTAAQISDLSARLASGA